MARAKIWRAHLRARQMCAQFPLLKKIVKNRICEVTHIVKNLRIWVSNVKILIFAFSSNFNIRYLREF